MKNILVTGGTVFVSKFVAQYFSSKKFSNDYQVYVLNRKNYFEFIDNELI
jgi:nucleoside-diphosphate-sugar epimerase